MRERSRAGQSLLAEIPAAGASAAGLPRIAPNLSCWAARLNRLQQSFSQAYAAAFRRALSRSQRQRRTSYKSVCSGRRHFRRLDTRPTVTMQDRPIVPDVRTPGKSDRPAAAPCRSSRSRSSCHDRPSTLRRVLFAWACTCLIQLWVRRVLHANGCAFADSNVLLRIRDFDAASRQLLFERP